MIRNWEHTLKQPAGHNVVLASVCLCAGLTTMAMHVIVAKARFIEESAP